ncbi:unnamed protein product [Prunus armeniaca]
MVILETRIFFYHRLSLSCLTLLPRNTAPPVSTRHLLSSITIATVNHRPRDRIRSNRQPSPITSRPASVVADLGAHRKLEKNPPVSIDFHNLQSSSSGYQIGRSRSKNKSGSKLGVLPKLGVWASGLEFFRPPEISQATQAVSAWAALEHQLTRRRDLPKVQRGRTNHVAFGYDDVHGHPGCLRILSVAFGLVSMLDGCPTSSMVPGLVWSEDADQVDQGPLNPARLQLGLTLCHRDLRGRVTNGDARGIDGYQELTETKGYT